MSSRGSSSPAGSAGSPRARASGSARRRSSAPAASTSFRFLRLAVVIGAAYWALFRWLHPLLFDDRLRSADARHDERAARPSCFAAACISLFVAALAAVNVDRRLRQSAGGRRGSPQHARRARGIAPFHSAPAHARRSACTCSTCSPCSSSCGCGFKWRRRAAAPAWWALLAAQVYLLSGSGPAVVHRLGSRVLPGRAGARRLHRRAGAALARLAGGRGDRESDK